MTAAHPEPLDGIEDRELAYLIERGDLSEDEMQFVQAFLRTRNVAKAARLIGMTDGPGAKVAQVAYGLRRLPRVSESISACIAMRMELLKASPARIEQELCKVAFANIGDIIEIQPDGTAYLDFSKATPENMAAVKSFACEVVTRPGDDPDAPREVLKMKVEKHSKLDALTKLAQIHKMIGNTDAVNEAVVDIAEAIRGGRARVAKLNEGTE